jgi:hypothetical protein
MPILIGDEGFLAITRPGPVFCLTAFSGEEMEAGVEKVNTD